MSAVETPLFVDQPPQEEASGLRPDYFHDNNPFVEHVVLPGGAVMIQAVSVDGESALPLALGYERWQLRRECRRLHAAEIVDSSQGDGGAEIITFPTARVRPRDDFGQLEASYAGSGSI